VGNNKDEKGLPSHRTWYTSRWVWVLVSIITIGVLPLLINWVLKMKAPLEILKAEWSAGEALGFYGTLLGSAATIIAVVITILCTNKQNRRAEQHQLNLLIAENKKIFLNEKYDNIFKKLENIKDVILLKEFEDEGFIDKMQYKVFTSYPQKLWNCYLDSEHILSLIRSGSEIETEFYKLTIEIIESLKAEFIKFCESVNELENNSPIKPISYEKIDIILKKKLNYDVYLNDSIKETSQENNPKQKSINDLYTEFRDVLFDNKRKYDTDFLSKYHNYINYLKNEQQHKIDDFFKKKVQL